jgi:hypothetical protein
MRPIAGFRRRSDISLVDLSEEIVPIRHLAILIGAMAVASAAVADGTPPKPKYPPGWDCSSVAAGSQRTACNRSQLDPPMGTIPNTRPGTQQQPFIVPPPQVPIVPTGRPKGVPPLPGTIDNGN